MAIAKLLHAWNNGCCINEMFQRHLVYFDSTPTLVVTLKTMGQKKYSNYYFYHSHNKERKNINGSIRKQQISEFKNKKRKK